MILKSRKSLIQETFPPAAFPSGTTLPPAVRPFVSVRFLEESERPSCVLRFVSTVSVESGSRETGEEGLLKSIKKAVFSCEHQSIVKALNRCQIKLNSCSM